MPKKKMNTKKKVVSSKVSYVSENKSKKCSSSWIWWALGILVLLTVLFFVYKGMTGNVITGHATSTEEAFKPIVQMVSGLIKEVYTALEPALKYVVGDTSGGKGVLSDGASVFFAKILLLILVFTLVSAILKKSGVDFLKDGAPHWVSCAIVAILSIRFLTVDFVQTILMPYSTFGVVLTSVLPFVFYFLFVEKGMSATKTPPIVRKVAWIFFAVVFLAIYLMRLEDFSDKAGIVATIYLLTALVAFLMAIFDGTIQVLFNKYGTARIKAHANSKNRVYLHDLLNECSDKWQEAVRRGALDSYKARVAGSVGVDSGQKAYEADLAEITRKINALS